MGGACTTLMSWVEVNNEDRIMEKLTKKKVIPKQESSRTIGTFEIGSIYIKQPAEKYWLLAKRISGGLTSLLIDIMYGSKTKFYNKIVKAKARYTTQVAQHARETMDQ